MAVVKRKGNKIALILLWAFLIAAVVWMVAQ
jgi:hypothetical protein